MDKMERMDELRAFKKVDEERTCDERREYGLPPAYSGLGGGSKRDSRDELKVLSRDFFFFSLSYR
jgi:hypothetical protein